LNYVNSQASLLVSGGNMSRIRLQFKWFIPNPFLHSGKSLTKSALAVHIVYASSNQFFVPLLTCTNSPSSFWSSP